eukprot:g375.t1
MGKKGKSLIAGGLAGMIARTAIAPIERIKILYQIDSALAGSQRIVPFVTSVYSESGVRGFWKGNAPAVLRVAPYMAMQFFAYEEYKLFIKRHDIFCSKTVTNLVAGAAAGITAVTVTYPLDVVRARLAMQTEGRLKGRPYKGMLDALMKIPKEEGVRALYRGMGATNTGVAPYAGIKFASYEAFKGIMCVAMDVDEPQLPTLARVTSGAAAGAVAQTFVYPLDVVRRRMQTGVKQYSSVYGALRSIAVEEGISKGLYRGLSLNYAKTLPNVAIYMSLYDIIKRVIIIGGMLCSLFVANAVTLYGKYAAHRRLQRKSEKLVGRSSASTKDASSTSVEIESVPITLVTGFLGSGKTTLLNEILQRGPDELGLRLMVLVNEFGRLSVDHSLLLDSSAVRKDEDILHLKNGCMCCAIGTSGESELERIFDRLIALPGGYNHVLIETTGLADPQPIISNLEKIRMAGGRFYVDAVVTVIDAKRSKMSRDEEVQIAFADVILLNKVDQVRDEIRLNTLKRQCRDRNPIAQVHCTEFGRVTPISRILGIRSFEPQLFRDRTHQRSSVSKGQSHRARLEKERVGSHTFERAAAVNMRHIKRWLEDIQNECGADLLRVKGLLTVDVVTGRRFIVNGIGADVSASLAKRPGKCGEPHSYIVVIGRRIERIVETFEKKFESCRMSHARAYAHARGNKKESSCMDASCPDSDCHTNARCAGNKGL